MKKLIEIFFGTGAAATFSLIITFILTVIIYWFIRYG
jgi:hypothetical protein